MVKVDNPGSNWRIDNLSISSFTTAAKNADAIYLSIDGKSVEVLGTGMTPSGRPVSWIASDIDTNSAFKQAMERTYGQGISQAIAKELGITSGPGKPLASRTVSQAIEMAETSKIAFAGMNFATQLECSAISGGRIFTESCKELGIDSQSINSQTKQEIDTQVAKKISQLEQQLNNGIVDSNTIKPHLEQILAAILKNQ